MGQYYNYKDARNRYLKNKKEITAYNLKKYYERKEKILNPKITPVVNIKMENVVLDFS